MQKIHRMYARPHDTIYNAFGYNCYLLLAYEYQGRSQKFFEGGFSNFLYEKNSGGFLGFLQIEENFPSGWGFVTQFPPLSIHTFITYYV